MARWTSMTMDEFRQRFHAGQERGRISWLAALVQCSQSFLAVEAARTVLAWRHGSLDASFASAAVIFSMSVLIASLILLAFLMRRANPEKEKVFFPVVLGSLCAAVVLFLCMAKLS